MDLTRGEISGFFNIGTIFETLDNLDKIHEHMCVFCDNNTYVNDFQVNNVMNDYIRFNFGMSCDFRIINHLGT